MNEQYKITVADSDARSRYAVKRLVSLGVDASVEMKNGNVVVLPPNSAENVTVGGAVVPTCEFVRSARAVIGPSAAEKYAGGVPFFDYSGNECFLRRNAALTAEGAVGIMICSLPFSVCGSNTAVLGFGRIGRRLSEMLTSLGSSVTVFARREETRRDAAKICRAADFPDFRGGFDCVINTVPSKTVDAQIIDGWFIELASAPFGFDADDRALLCDRFIIAAGLPGKTAPREAGYALADAAYDILKGDFFK